MAEGTECLARGAAFFTDRLPGDGPELPQLTESIYSKPRSKWIWPALCHQRAECLGKYILLPKINANKSPDPPPLASADFPTINYPATLWEVGAIPGFPLHQHPTQSTIRPSCDLHVSTPIHFFLSPWLLRHLLPELPQPPPKGPLALPLSTKRSKDVGKSTTLSYLNLQRFPTKLGAIQIPFPSPTRPVWCGFCLSFPLSISPHPAPNPPETISWPVEWAEYNLPSRLGVRPPRYIEVICKLESTAYCHQYPICNWAFEFLTPVFIVSSSTYLYLLLFAILYPFQT